MPSEKNTSIRHALSMASMGVDIAGSYLGYDRGLGLIGCASAPPSSVGLYRSNPRRMRARPSLRACQLSSWKKKKRVGRNEQTAHYACRRARDCARGPENDRYRAGGHGSSGFAGDGHEAVAKAQELLLPDVLVMDISMPKPNGLQATLKLIECCP